MEGGELRLGFEEVHAAHRDFFRDQDMLELLRAALEAETGSPLSVRVVDLPAAPGTGLDAPAAAPREAGPDPSAYGADPLVLVLQSMFSATMRGAYRGDDKPPYHLGMSCNFRVKTAPEERKD